MLAKAKFTNEMMPSAFLYAFPLHQGCVRNKCRAPGYSYAIATLFCIDDLIAVVITSSSSTRKDIFELFLWLSDSSSIQALPPRLLERVYFSPKVNPLVIVLKC